MYNAEALCDYALYKCTFTLQSTFTTDAVFVERKLCDKLRAKAKKVYFDLWTSKRRLTEYQGK